MKTYRYAIVIISFIISILVAAAVGTGLALFDQGIAVGDVVNYLMESNQDIVADTHTIVNSQENTISQYTVKNEKPVVGSSNQIEPIISMPEPLQELAYENNKASKDAEEETKEVDEKETTDENDETDADAVLISAEISAVPVITKAGSDEEILSTSMVEQNVVTGEFRDPVATFPLDYAEVDESYFNDALFIGDSRVNGLGMYSGTNATFYAATAFQLFDYKTFKVVPTSNGKVPIFDVMPYDKFTKVYIKVGLNELGCVSEEKFISVYQEFITQIRLMQPRAIIYLQAVFPVTAAKSSSNNTHTNPKIAARNESIKALAAANNCYYIDASEPFLDETGALRAETTADGIHMYARFMPQWIEYLRKHAVPWP